MNKSSPTGASLRKFGQTNTAGLILLTVITWTVYSAFGQGFLSSFNLFALSQLAAQFAVIGFAQLVVIAIGRMNIAVGAVGLVAAMATGWMMGPLGLDPAIAITAGLILGTAAGALMGWLELKTGLNSFIVTLAMASIYTGAVLIISGREAISSVPASVTQFGAASLFTPYLSPMILPALAVAALLWWLYKRTSLGWKLLAVGANQTAAALSGVRVNRAVLVSFGLSGLLCGVAAVMEMSRVAAALPSLGSTWLLTAFIVPILGGSSMKGGSVSIGGALVAALFLASINSGLVSLNVPVYWQQLSLSLVLLVAVVADEARRRRRSRLSVAALIPENAATARKEQSLHV
jgi:ribose transport system permease protein